MGYCIFTLYLCAAARKKSFAVGKRKQDVTQFSVDDLD